MYTANKPNSSDHKQKLVAEDDLPDLSLTDSFSDIIKSLPEEEPIPPAIVYFGILTRQLYLDSNDYSINFDGVPIEQAPKAVVPPKTLHIVRKMLLDCTDELNEQQKKAIGEFIESTNLNRHPKNGCTPEKSVNITIEQYPLSVTWLKEDSESSNSKAHECPYCSKEYTNINEFKSHKNKCSERNPKKNSQSKDRSKYECPHCSRSYDGKMALKGHKKKCSSKNSSKDTNNTNNESRLKYKCKYCKKKFSKKKKRNKHEEECSESNLSGSSSGGSVGKSVKKDNRGERVAGKNPFADANRLKDTGLHQGGG